MTEEAVNEVYCYRDQGRLCAGDCVAFLVNPPQDREYSGQAWARCADLLSRHRLAKHLTIIAGVVSNPSPAASINLLTPPVVR